MLRQASARSRRPTQTLPCKVFFLYYNKTIQEKALALMGEKEAASQALEGTFDIKGLSVLMNGGENDDILAALAQNLGGNADATKAWAALNPIKAPPLPAPANRMADKRPPRTSAKPTKPRSTYRAFSLKPGSLFDLAPCEIPVLELN